MGSQNTTNGEKQLLVMMGLLILANEDVLSFSECMIPLRCTSIHKIGHREVGLRSQAASSFLRINVPQRTSTRTSRGDSDMHVRGEREGHDHPLLHSAAASRHVSSACTVVGGTVSLSIPGWGSRPGTFPAWPGHPASSRHPPCLPARSAEG